MDPHPLSRVVIPLLALPANERDRGVQVGVFPSQAARLIAPQVVERRERVGQQAVRRLIAPEDRASRSMVRYGNAAFDYFAVAIVD